VWYWRERDGFRTTQSVLPKYSYSTFHQLQVLEFELVGGLVGLAGWLIGVLVESILPRWLALGGLVSWWPWAVALWPRAILNNILNIYIYGQNTFESIPEDAMEGCRVKPSNGAAMFFSS
jgi:hypothetical protein